VPGVDLLCALTTAVRDLQVADDLIDETFEEQGIYGVSFFVEGRWRMVWVDAYFPCTAKPLAVVRTSSHHRGSTTLPSRQLWRPLFARMKDTKEIWSLVVEKAYAKLKGNYSAIVGGQPSVALQLLTGAHLPPFASLSSLSLSLSFS
jgi:hypothetical protein